MTQTTNDHSVAMSLNNLKIATNYLTINGGAALSKDDAKQLRAQAALYEKAIAEGEAR